MQRKLVGAVAGAMLMSSVAFAANVVPTVTTFIVAPSTISPVPVTAFTGTDTDGTVVAYIITESSNKPAATAAGWTTTKPTSYTTTKTGSLTLYGYVKDNAAGVSTGKSAATTVIGAHTHNQSDVVGLAASLEAKADVSALAAKADVTALAAKADVSALAAKADVTALASKSDINHNHEAIYQKKYVNISVVGLTDGDDLELNRAIDNAAIWCPVGPCLLKIMPGIYHAGVLNMPVGVYITWFIC